MYSDGAALTQLSRDECLTLLASVPVGRIIYTRRALPAVELVNFAFDHDDIVIRTDRGGKLAAAARGLAPRFVLGDSLPPLIALWREIVARPAHVASTYATLWRAQPRR